jgi:hypothetical protein
MRNLAELTMLRGHVAAPMTCALSHQTWFILLRHSLLGISNSKEGD